MAEQKGAPSLLIRVVQGIVLGIVLSVPVVLWGLSRIENAAEETEPTAESPGHSSKTNGKPGFRKVKPGTYRKRTAAPVAEAETIPAAQMHLRIDDGSHASASGSAAKGDLE